MNHLELETWINHFARNGRNRPEPPWDIEHASLEPKTKAALLSSLQQFQLGDGGGPAYLIGRDLDQYFADHPRMKQMVDLWFKEEERHSELLGKAVERFGGSPIEEHWSFSIFCKVRKYLGVRFELYALLLTEITSNNYYKLLRKYAPDAAIKAMCDLIIRDETGHISFHRDRIATRMDGSQSLGFFWAAKMYVLAFLAGSMLWVNHRKALVSLGATTREFYTGFLAETGRFISAARTRREKWERHLAAGPMAKTG